jgi:tetratricopeptide (TPR) repeat protein
MNKSDINRRKYGIAVFAASLMVYVFTACRTVYVGDSGELTLALMTGGIAHPPGYPLYTILGYVWLKLFFFLRPAVAANIFSAVTAASTSVVLFLLLKRIVSGRIPSRIPAALSLMSAFAYPVWMSATNAEVYALSGLLYAGALYTIVGYYQEGRLRSLIMAAFLAGLTLAHHFSAGVIIAGYILVEFLRKANYRPGLLIPARIVVFLPLTLYAYLLLRFDPNLPINWMAEKSFGALWGMFSGEIYRQFVSLPTVGDLLLFVKKISMASLYYFGPGPVLLAVPGIIIGFRQKTRLSLLLAIPAVLNILMVSAYHIPDYEGYLIPSLITVTIFAGIFLDWVWSRFNPHKVVTHAVTAFLVVIPLLANYSRCDIGDFDLAERYGKDILDSAADNSLLFLKSDNGSHAALYLHYAEDYRPDLDIYSTNGTLTRLQDRYGKIEFATIMNNLGVGINRIFWGTEYIINLGMNPSAGEKIIRGILYGRSGDEDNPEISHRITAFTQDELPDIDLHQDLKARQIYLEYQLHHIDRMIRSGDNFILPQKLADLRKWGRRLADPMTCLAVAQFFRTRGMIDQSLKWVDLAEESEPFSYERKDLYVNLGIIYRQAGDLRTAGQALSRALDIDPVYTPARYNAYLVKAEMALQDQDWTAALESIDTLIEMDPDNPLPYFNKAVIYERLTGGAAEAVRNYRIFISKTGISHSQAVARAQDRIEALESMNDPEIKK